MNNFKQAVSGEKPHVQANAGTFMIVNALHHLSKDL